MLKALRRESFWLNLIRLFFVLMLVIVLSLILLDGSHTLEMLGGLAFLFALGVVFACLGRACAGLNPKHERLLLALYGLLLGAAQLFLMRHYAFRAGWDSDIVVAGAQAEPFMMPGTKDYLYTYLPIFCGLGIIGLMIAGQRIYGMLR